ncbi:metalloregulator ArsR/SmtB family transcription factor [Poseidonibacter lekithochrous]|uniref:ArsR/SmtB family transcription factor n=1 Tax=Poseidonibacter TaxID=2321187 RepID=UPI001C0A628D|nr:MULTISPECIES: metalloregulator ArsR/SmtB family transcription factor [Poseidonibacter]MBU3015618.1 metalloregulator ArsR/SmtB family transcription factor [Poseidonibacter lekithochrous]MDO6828918.1 metalloregulator ArsR/SmtB family transcription factor [Poseidonibacter sp. 1_MG-2023]
MGDSNKLIRSCCEGISYISDIKDALPNDDTLITISNVSKALSDPTRMKILYALLEYEICVGEMVNVLGIPQSHVSHQLRTLKKYGIVDFKKDKKMSFYYIKDEYIRELLLLLLKNKELLCQVKK